MYFDLIFLKVIFMFFPPPIDQFKTYIFTKHSFHEKTFLRVKYTTNFLRNRILFFRITNISFC